MPPFTSSRWITARYAPYNHPVSLHKIWRPEKAYDQEKLTIHRIFPLDSGVAASPMPRQFPDTANLPLSGQPACTIVSLIPKPPGEVGRRSPRGYSLRQTLQWKDYIEVLTYIKDLVKQHFDLSLVIAEQDPIALAKVYAAAEKKYPRFLNYADNWALTDFLKSARKYLNSGRSGDAGDEPSESESEGQKNQQKKKKKATK